MSHRVLVIDDDASVCRSIARGLKRFQLDVATAGGGSEALELLAAQIFDAVVCDLRMPGVDGLQVLDFTRSLDRAPPFVLLTGFATIELAVRAVQRGADDFIEKPIEIDALANKISALVEGRRRGRDDAGLDLVVGRSQRWQDVKDEITTLAKSDATLLIEGETGTGKSLAARALWQSSYRSHGRFVVVDCAALSASGRELFGEELEDGTEVQGHIAAAKGGVALLEEVSELDMGLQSQLLTVLQDRSYCPIGGSQPRLADVRFLATTNRNLWRRVQTNRFRNDLFFRLNVLRLEVPPLREHTEDIPLLVEHFLEVQAKNHAIQPPFVTNEALMALTEYPWPGNIRQLGNVIERCALACDRYITARDVRSELIHVPCDEVEAIRADPADAFGLVEGASLPDAVRGFERTLIRNALHQCGGNQTQAARLLNVSRTTLIAKMKRLELTGPG